MLNCGHSFCNDCLILMLPQTCSQDANVIQQLATTGEDYKKQAKIFDQGDASVEVMCPECQVTMRLTRVKSSKIDLAAVLGKKDDKQIAEKKDEAAAGQQGNTVKGRYLTSIWLSSLVKNYALIQLVEAQRNLEEMQKIAQ